LQTCADRQRFISLGTLFSTSKKEGLNIEWRQGKAEALPFSDGNFDLVLSQFALMFFEHRRAALSETLRVLRPGGRLAVSVWQSLERRCHT
jgi:ubiquinone/menaquinone biosynthesis C-methylase UbiE